LNTVQAILLAEARRAIANFYSHKRAHRSGSASHIPTSECTKCHRTAARIIRNTFLLGGAFQ
jgi:hypothetical protein